MNEFEKTIFRINLIKQAAGLGGAAEGAGKGLKIGAKGIKGVPGIGDVISGAMSAWSGITKGLQQSKAFNIAKVKDITKGKIPNILKDISKTRLFPPRP